MEHCLTASLDSTAFYARLCALMNTSGGLLHLTFKSEPSSKRESDLSNSLSTNNTFPVKVRFLERPDDAVFSRPPPTGDVVFFSVVRQGETVSGLKLMVPALPMGELALLGAPCRRSGSTRVPLAKHEYLESLRSVDADDAVLSSLRQTVTLSEAEAAEPLLPAPTESDANENKSVYRYLRHPKEIAVQLMLFGIPLMNVIDDHQREAVLHLGVVDNSCTIIGLMVQDGFSPGTTSTFGKELRDELNKLLGTALFPVPPENAVHLALSWIRSSSSDYVDPAGYVAVLHASKVDDSLKELLTGGQLVGCEYEQPDGPNAYGIAISLSGLGTRPMTPHHVVRLVTLYDRVCVKCTFRTPPGTRYCALPEPGASSVDKERARVMLSSFTVGEKGGPVLMDPLEAWLRITRMDGRIIDLLFCHYYERIAVQFGRATLPRCLDRSLFNHVMLVDEAGTLESVRAAWQRVRQSIQRSWAEKILAAVLPDSTDAAVDAVSHLLEHVEYLHTVILVSRSGSLLRTVLQRFPCRPFLVASPFAEAISLRGPPAVQLSGELQEDLAYVRANPLSDGLELLQPSPPASASEVERSLADSYLRHGLPRNDNGARHVGIDHLVCEFEQERLLVNRVRRRLKKAKKWPDSPQLVLVSKLVTGSGASSLLARLGAALCREAVIISVLDARSLNEELARVTAHIQSSLVLLVDDYVSLRALPVTLQPRHPVVIVRVLYDYEAYAARKPLGFPVNPFLTASDLAKVQTSLKTWLRGTSEKSLDDLAQYVRTASTHKHPEVRHLFNPLLIAIAGRDPGSLPTIARRYVEDRLRPVSEGQGPGLVALQALSLLAVYGVRERSLCGAQRFIGLIPREGRELLYTDYNAKGELVACIWNVRIAQLVLECSTREHLLSEAFFGRVASLLRESFLQPHLQSIYRDLLIRRGSAKFSPLVQRCLGPRCQRDNVASLFERVTHIVVSQVPQLKPWLLKVHSRLLYVLKQPSAAVMVAGKALKAAEKLKVDPTKLLTFKHNKATCLMHDKQYRAALGILKELQRAGSGKYGSEVNQTAMWCLEQVILNSRNMQEVESAKLELDELKQQATPLRPYRSDEEEEEDMETICHMVQLEEAWKRQLALT